MELKKVIKMIKGLKLGLGLKLTLAIGSISSVLLLSCLLSVIGFSRMSTYVSGRIADDASAVSTLQHISDLAESYNRKIFVAIGSSEVAMIPDYDFRQISVDCETLRTKVKGSAEVAQMVDSLELLYKSYILTSLELNSILLSDYSDSREWYFERLQPRFEDLNQLESRLTSAIYSNLYKSSRDFDSGFYRSIVPGFVATAVGIILSLMLLFFVLTYYVKPLLSMNEGMKGYNNYGKSYNIKFEGDDQLVELNDGIREVTEENRQLKTRIANLRTRLQAQNSEKDEH